MLGYISTKDFAKRIGKSRVWIWYLIKAKKIEAILKDKRYWIPESELLKYLKESKIKEAPGPVKKTIYKGHWFFQKYQDEIPDDDVDSRAYRR